MRIIKGDPTSWHDYNLITMMFPVLDVNVVSARVLEIRRMDSKTLSG